MGRRPKTIPPSGRTVDLICIVTVDAPKDFDQNTVIQKTVSQVLDKTNNEVKLRQVTVLKANLF